MPTGHEDGSSRRTYLLPNKRLGRMLVLGAVFVAALAARLYRIDNPAVDYQPTRQYRSALIARTYYYRSLERIPPWEKEVAESNLATEPRLEVPIMEYLTALAYRVAGGEHFWIPRAFSSLCWVIGGVFVYAMAGRIASRDAALLATAFYLFLPFGVKVSRAFQRDVPMLMLMLIGLFLLVRYAERRSLVTLLIAAVVSSLAIFIKPICVPVLFGAYVALAIQRVPRFRAVFIVDFLIFWFIALVPTAVYTWYGMFVAEFLAAQAHRSFLPYLMKYPFFWHGWLKMLQATVSYPALSLALLGVALFRTSFSRALALGLWAGYVVFGLIFNFGIHTHSYYQLMLIPIVAISMTPVADIVLQWLRQPTRPAFLRAASWAVLILAICLSLEPLLWLRADPKWARMVEIRQEIAAAVDHSTKTIILDRAYGKVLKYHGKMCGDWWPSWGDIRQFQLRGEPEMSTEERLDEKIREHAPEFFIVAAMGEFNRQKDLRELLAQRYGTLRHTEDYIIYDMRTRIDL